MRPSLRELLCLIFVLFFVLASLAQSSDNRYILQERVTRASFTVLPNAGLDPGPVSSTDGNVGIKLSELRQEGADLLLITEVAAQKGYQLSYDLRAHLTGPMGVSQRIDPVFSRRGGELRMRLEDIRETGWYPGGSYQVTMTVATMGDIDCATGPPSARLRGLALASGGGAIIGLASVAYAATLRNQNRIDYDRYLSGWREGLPFSETLNQQLDDITQRQTDADLLTLAGSILVAVGGTVYTLLASTNRRRRNTYRRFCTTTPATQVTIIAPPAGGLGVSLNHRF